jgi:hypothetical protein
VDDRPARGEQVTITDYAEIVSALRSVAGVAEAEVQPDEDGSGLGLLRLGLEQGADEVQVATDVGRMLRERFGLGVDADRVQLIEDTATPADVHIDEQTTQQPPVQRGERRNPAIGRPVIGRMQLVTSDLDVTAKVSLRFGGRTVVGESTGTATSTGVQRAVAGAALRALEELVERAARFDLEEIEVNPTGRQRTVLVVVTMLSERGSERLTGSASVREDLRQACIRATLNAVNRRLQLLLG